MEIEYRTGQHSSLVASSTAPSTSREAKTRRISLRQRESMQKSTLVHSNQKAKASTKHSHASPDDDMDIDNMGPSSSGDLLVHESLSLSGRIREMSSRSNARTEFLTRLKKKTDEALSLAQSMEQHTPLVAAATVTAPPPPPPIAPSRPPSSSLSSASSASLASALQRERQRANVYTSRPASASINTPQHFISTDGNWEQRRRSPLWLAAAAATATMLEEDRSGERMFSRLIAGAGKDQAGLCQASELEAAADYLMAKSTMTVPNPTMEPCCICLNDMAEGEAVCLIVKCTHRLHASCLRRWVRGKAALTCPLCRS